MKTILSLACILAVAAAMTSCDTMPAKHPTPTPTAENGATHGSPKQPSTQPQ